MNSLFIGRWQPFHKGHRELIDKVLKEKKPVVIAIRDTLISEENPYTVDERKQMIKEAYEDEVDIIVVPDIEEVCYGRKVGYKIRELRLDEDIENNYSGTKSRNSQKRVIWFTGNTGSGKTSLAYLLKERLNAIVLDGDEMRASISVSASFSKKDRHAHNLRVARLAKVLHDQGHNVVVSVIAPFEKTRKEINKICDPYWIYIKSGERGKESPYEPPKDPDIIVDPTIDSQLESLEKIVKDIGQPGNGNG